MSSKEKAKSSKPVCGAPLRKKPGKTCHSPFVYPNGRCRLHNGNALKGLDHPRVKNAYLSKSLPVKVFARMNEFLEDNAILDLKTDIAFISVRIEELCQRIQDQNDSVSVWRKLLSIKRDVLTAKTDDERADKMRLLLNTIDMAEKEIAVYDEIHKLLEQRRKFVESETTRQLKLAAGITLEQINVFYHAIASAVKEEVDAATLARIFAKFDAINHRNNSQLLEAQAD